LPDRLKKLEDERPVELEVRRFRNPQPEEQIKIPDMTATELTMYNSWARRFDRDEAKWLTKEKALQNLSRDIVQSIDIKHLDLILDFADAYSQLRTLKKHLCPSIGERNHQLRAQYRDSIPASAYSASHRSRTAKENLRLGLPACSTC
jgi:hypothetical protein